MIVKKHENKTSKTFILAYGCLVLYFDQNSIPLLIS